LCSNAREIATRNLKASRLSFMPISEEIAGAFVNSHNEVASHYDAGQQGFTTEDILLAAGIWSVILTLSPLIVFYMLMVA
jgi:hypothetical protein